MKVYLKETKSAKVYSIITKEDQKVFKFKKIPQGEYIAYAYTLEQVAIDPSGKKSKAKGGFTNAVPCGLTIGCNDHSLIKINLKNKMVSATISICDWYGAIVPPEEK